MHRLRRVLGLLLVASALTACAGAPSGPGPSRGGEDGRVVVALDDFAAVNALSLGVAPDLVLEVFDYTSTAALFDDAGLTTAPYGPALDVEQVLAADPDVILGVSIPTTVEVQDDLAAIAPTTVLDYTGTWQEQLAATADALGVPDRAVALQERLDADLADLSADLAGAGLGGATVSVLGDLEDFFSPPAATPVGAVLTGAGLDRPAAQQRPGTADAPFVTFSAEALGEHAGDVVYLLSGGRYPTAGLTGSPLWPQIEAAADGGVHEVSAEVWFGSSAFTVDWIVRDLRATLLDAAPAARDADAPARFRTFPQS